MAKQNTSQGKLALQLFSYGAVFLIPVVIVLITLFWLQMYPFGQNNLSTWDLQYTYSYFNEWFRSVLSGDANIFYSFSKSLGGNMYAGFACLLTSPINWLIPLFGSNPVDFLTFAIILKFGLAGISAYFYLSRRFTLDRSFNIILSVCYAMSLFMTTQSANPMWMEAVIVLPLVMYGIYLLIHQGKVVFFFVALLASIVLNFYNGYMICLFCILFYLFESYLAVPTAKRVRLKIMVNPGRFAATYSLAILASVIILMPTVIGLMGGKGAVPPGLFTADLRFEPTDILHTLYLGIYQRELLPQIFTGTIATIGAVWFFLNQATEKRSKIAMAILLSFMLFSTWFAPLDRIWLGLRDGNHFYCRFTFLIAFLLIFCTASALSTIQSRQTIQTNQTNQTKPALKALKQAVLLVMVAAAFVYADKIYEVLNILGLPFIDASIYVYYFVIVVVISLYFYFVLRQSLRKADNRQLQNILTVILVLVISGEFVLSCAGAFKYRMEDQHQTSYTKYQNYYDQGHTMMAQLDATDGSAVNAYRMEKTFNIYDEFLALSPDWRITLNETLAFGYQGVGLYDSAYDDRVQNVLHRLGYTPDKYIYVSFNDSMVVADSLIGLKYMVSKERPLGYLDTEVQTSWDDGRLYQNPDALPLGFAVDNSILQTIDFNGNPFDYQDQFISALIGQNTDCLIPLEVSKATSDSDGDNLAWEVQAPKIEDALVFGYIEGPSDKWQYLIAGDRLRYNYLNEWSHGMFPLTDKSEDGSYKLALRGPELETVSDIELHAVYLDKTVFSKAMATLAAKPFAIEVFDDGYVKGTYPAQGDELLFTTIPYDVGWTVKLNGQVVEPQIVQEAFIALEMEDGLNQIEMRYISPGFVPGAIISGVACALFVLFAIMMRRRDRQRADCQR